MALEVVLVGWFYALHITEYIIEGEPSVVKRYMYMHDYCFVVNWRNNSGDEKYYSRLVVGSKVHCLTAWPRPIIDEPAEPQARCDYITLQRY